MPAGRSIVPPSAHWWRAHGSVVHLLLSVFACVTCIASAGAAVESPSAGDTAKSSTNAVRNPVSHWAFSPPAPVTAPAVRRSSWVSTPVDLFILAGLEARDLRPTPPASRETLLRRVYLDLIGLPPTLAAIDAFVVDRRPDAWARVVDQLLASPHYGERWARHWLDVVRYAESDGFEHDAARPNSWRYRDYVVRAFNADKPYDRFVQEQIAGDELWPGEPDAVVATAFNLLGPDMVDSADQVQRRLLTLSDMTDTTATAFLGLTLGCARCHDHKLEPISQADYYAFQAHFAGAQFHQDFPVPTAQERQDHEHAMADYNARTGRLQRELAELENPVQERLRETKLAAMSEDVQLAHRTPRDRRTPEQESSVLETGPHLQVTAQELTSALEPDARKRRAALQAELKQVPKPAALPLTLALQNTNGPVPPTHVLLRGDYNNPGAEVHQTVPVALRTPPPSPPRKQPSPTTASTSEGNPASIVKRRAALARWLTAPDNPLTARVFVNRVWQHHFGRGLVVTPNDFGTQGARPTHPELLDWLALKFMNDGWSIKALHRVILLSSAYRQSTDVPNATRRADPDNRWLSRQNRARLEGEVLRDSLLFISGQLNPQLAGPSVQPPIAEDIIKTSRNWTASAEPADHHRRSLYILARRNLRFPFLEVFDAPDSNLSCPERGQSTTAPQSLALLNSVEVGAAARATGRALLADHTRDEDRLEAAFRRILGRRPDRAERSHARSFLATTRALADADASADPASAEPAREWIELCRALFNLNDFVYAN